MQRLQNELTEKICEIFDFGSNFVNVKNVSMKKDVRDATFKFLAENSAGEALVFILAANDEFPDAVHWAAQAAEKAKVAVGEGLAPIVVAPLNAGYVGQNSFAVYRCYTPTKPGVLTRLIRRRSVDPKVFQWLADVAKATSRPVDDSRIENLVIAPLQWLLDCPAFSTPVRDDAKSALHALDANQWQPRCVFSHNDLWKGNVLVESKYGPRLASYGFGEPRIIDWLGSSSEGIPAFDAIKYALSVGLHLKGLRDVVNQINAATRTDDAGAFFDLIAGLGRLGINRGEFPLDRFMALAETTISTYRYLMFTAPPFPESDK